MSEKLSDKPIVLAADHAGVALKAGVKAWLEQHGYAVEDIGASDVKKSVDYPDYGYKAAERIASGASDFGVIICGSGIGISIAANRNLKVRAALCHNKETAELARQHNDANILALGGRTLDMKTALMCVETFFSTEFEGGRHTERVKQLGQPH